MANDNMRTGPRGSSDQAAWLRPMIFTLVQDGGGGIPLSPIITKANANDDAYIDYANFGNADWEVVEVRLIGVTTFVSPDCNFRLGVASAVSCYATGASGSVTFASGNEVVIPLDGTAPLTTFGATNGRLLLDNIASANAGSYTVQVFAKPVSGGLFTSA